MPFTSKPVRVALRALREAASAAPRPLQRRLRDVSVLRDRAVALPRHADERVATLRALEGRSAPLAEGGSRPALGGLIDNLPQA
jgi:hypothetical protein